MGIKTRTAGCLEVPTWPVGVVVGAVGCADSGGTRVIYDGA